MIHSLSHRVKCGLLVAISLVLCIASARALHQSTTIAELQSKAAKQVKDKNYRDATQTLTRLLAREDATSKVIVAAIGKLANCSRRMNDYDQLDAALVSLAESRGPDPEVMLAITQAAQTYLPQNGVIVDGRFKRGYGRWGGANVSVGRLDRIRSLNWLLAAVNQAETADAEVDLLLVAKLYDQIAAILLNNLSGSAWQLQELTDLDEELDYNAFENAGSRVASDAAPATDDGTPVLYTIPDSWAAATNDGQRLRYCIAQATKSAEVEPVALNRWAQFLSRQFSVTTMQRFGWFGRILDEDNTSERLKLHTLEDGETLARLASGVERFELPDDYHFIAIYKKLAENPKASVAQAAMGQLHSIHLNRRQYTRAATWLERSIEKFEDPRGQKASSLSAIRDARVALDSLSPLVANQKNSVGAKFRNTGQIGLQMQQVDVERLLRETKQFYSTPGNTRQRRPAGPTMPTSHLYDGSIDKYLLGEATLWSEVVQSPANHWDKRQEFDLPAVSGGLYLLTAFAQENAGDVSLEDSHQSRQLVWVQDYVLTRKDLEGGAPFYLLTDAKTGQPKVGTIEMFGFVQERGTNGRSADFRTDSRVARTSTDGSATAKLPLNMSWIVAARIDGRLVAILEHENSFAYHFNQPSKQAPGRVYCLTDRPIYRPGDMVRLKAWLADSGYDDVQAANLSRQTCTVSVVDGRNEKVFTASLTTDQLGGCDAEFQLPQSAGLGAYTLQVTTGGRRGVAGSVQFSVEEYRKPEYEVEIIAPDEPARLGETVKATVRAKYYFGTPVAGARANVQVSRTTASDDYYPITPYDWLYGPGYWWTAKQYNWLPGYSRWCGCIPPGPTFGNQPSEIVMSKTVTLDANGEAEIEIDTSLAKATFGDQNHRYTIEAEVRDASRRTIVGKADVVAAVDPFKIYAWTHRGFYSVGDEIQGNFRARRLDGKPVAGEGTVELYRLTYDTAGNVSERSVYQADVTVDSDGSLQHKLASQSAGQYRLVLKMADSAGRVVEGGYVFVIRGDRPADTKPENFRFAALELTPDRQTYSPGDTVKLQIASEYSGAYIALFQRSTDGRHTKPQFIQLDGKSQVIEFPVLAGDAPNFFVEAITVFEGKLYQETRSIAVPPSDKVLTVEVATDKEKYLPGEQAEITVSVTDTDGKPVAGSVVLAAYDRSLEQLAANRLPQDIREFFWKWQRTHYVNFASNVSQHGQPAPRKGQPRMEVLGAFGWNLADDQNRGGATLVSAMGGMGGGGAPMPMSRAMAPAGMASMEMADSAMVAGRQMKSGGAATEEVGVRKSFADSAIWLAAVSTDANGKFTRKIELPENLSSWQVKAWGMASGVRVGSGQSQVVTHKPLLVRLITPRFLTEGDQATLSTIVHNDFDDAQDVSIVLEIDGETQLQLGRDIQPEKTIRIAAKGEARLDWPVTAIAGGSTTIRAKIRSRLGSDGVEQALEVLPYGMQRTESFAGTVRADQDRATITFDVPEKRYAQRSSLIVRASPSLAMAMVDSLPYLIEYPYGCTEQTLNRFLPAVLTQNTLTHLGVILEDLQASRNNLNAQQIAQPERKNPIYDSKKLAEIVDQGVRKLTNSQLPDGSWGWFSGVGARANPHITLLALRGLQVARSHDIPMMGDMMPQGINWVTQYVAQRLEQITREDNPQSVRELDALALLVLSREEQFNPKLQQELMQGRDRLSVYGLSMMAIVAHRSGNAAQRDLLHQNIQQYLTVDAENDTAFIASTTPSWFWYGSTIESNAMYLKFLSLVDPKNENAPRLVKYLLNNRYHASHWRSTRDTALVVESLAEFIVASGENVVDCSAAAFLDGKRLGSVSFTPETLFTANNTIEISGAAITSGEHKLEIRRSGTSNLYYSVYASNYTRESKIKPAGLEVKVGRRYYRVTPEIDDTSAPDKSGRPVATKQERSVRTSLAEGDSLASGDVVEVELLIESKNDYEYILIEDHKPAGLEAIDSQSGYFYNARLYMYRELREKLVGLCIERLPHGNYSVRYQLRAEGPGKFQAPPATIAGMYAPELQGNSANATIEIAE